jgi:hypothetical protein
LTGPIVKVPVALRGARAVHLRLDALQLLVTLQSGRELLVLDRDAATGMLRYNGVARYASEAELSGVLELSGSRLVEPTPSQDHLARETPAALRPPAP